MCKNLLKSANSELKMGLGNLVRSTVLGLALAVGSYSCGGTEEAGGVEALGWANTLADGTPDPENTCDEWCWVESSASAKFKK